MKQRCLNPKHKAFPDYGGRGIGVAATWVKDFPAFFAHVGVRPSPFHSLGRIENEKGYEPGNVRWETSLEQNNNRRVPRSRRALIPMLKPDRVTNFKHGLIDTPEYNAWSLMKDRCLNLKSSNYPNWGGRGITICPEWRDDFPTFLRAVGTRPAPGYSLDRIDNEGPYEPGNVRWATKLEQTQNRRPCRTGPEHGNYVHGQVGSVEYKIWSSIKTRCFNTQTVKYASYGAVGVTMCVRWRESFLAFFEDVGSKPSPELNLSRKNLEGSYTCGKCDQCLAQGWPVNCHWATKTEQNRARRPSARSGKLDVARVAEIRQRSSSGETDRALAEAFGVGKSLVGKIRRLEVWV